MPPVPERRCVGVVGFIPRACKELGPHPQEPSGWGLAVRPLETLLVHPVRAAPHTNSALCHRCFYSYK